MTRTAAPCFHIYTHACLRAWLRDSRPQLHAVLHVHTIEPAIGLGDPQHTGTASLYPIHPASLLQIPCSSRSLLSHLLLILFSCLLTPFCHTPSYFLSFGITISSCSLLIFFQQAASNPAAALLTCWPSPQSAPSRVTKDSTRSEMTAASSRESLGQD